MQKISKYKTATTYAQAWFDAAKENHIEDAVMEEVRQLLVSMQQDTSLWAVLFQPADDNKEKVKIIRELGQRIGLTELSINTLSMVTENERLNLLKTILNTFIKLYYKDKGIIEVSVDTAVELTSTQHKKLQSTLEAKLQSPVVLNYRIKPEILGGLAIRYDSFLIDDTLIGKLKNIKRILLQQKAS